MPITLFGRAAAGVRRRRRSEAETASAPTPQPALRVLTLNVAHARRQAQHQALLREPTLRRNLEAIAAVLGRERPDVVALQEADGPSAWSGGFDHVETLARLAGFDHAFRGEHNPFSLGRLDLSSGTALLSRLPLEAPRSHAFQQTWRDTKGFVAATVTPDALGGAPVDVVSIHLDFLAERVRRRQVEQLVDRFSGSGRPFFFCNDCGIRIVETRSESTMDRWFDNFAPLASDVVLSPDVNNSPLLAFQVLTSPPLSLLFLDSYF